MSAINVLKVESIKLPTWTSKDVDTTGMSDAADDFIPGVPNFGECECDSMYLATQSNAIRALKNVSSTFVYTYPTGQIDTWTGWINSFGTDVSVKDKIKNKFKIRSKTDIVSTGTTTGTVTTIGIGGTLTITPISS